MAIRILPRRRGVLRSSRSRGIISLGRMLSRGLGLSRSKMSTPGLFAKKLLIPTWARQLLWELITTFDFRPHLSIDSSSSQNSTQTSIPHVMLHDSGSTRSKSRQVLFSHVLRRAVLWMFDFNRKDAQSKQTTLDHAMATINRHRSSVAMPMNERACERSVYFKSSLSHLVSSCLCSSCCIFSSKFPFLSSH